jgi:hypothetical protein
MWEIFNSFWHVLEELNLKFRAALRKFDLALGFMLTASKPFGLGNKIKTW